MESVKHKIKLDANIEVTIEIPVELDALEFAAIVEKARKILKLSDVEIEKKEDEPMRDFAVLPHPKRKYDKYTHMSAEEVKRMVQEYENCPRDQHEAVAVKWGCKHWGRLARKVWYYKNR